MKKRTINIFPILLVFLLLLVGCRDSGQESRAEWDQEAGILTVDSVRYRKDETLVSIGDGLQRWRYEQFVTEQIASAGERGGQETYLVFANGTERRLLYGCALQRTHQPHEAHHDDRSVPALWRRLCFFPFLHHCGFLSFFLSEIP